jgi:integrase
MPKIAKERSPAAVRRLMDRPGFHSVGGVIGLHLQVTDRKARSWVLRAKYGGKRRDIGLGSFPTVTLQMARDRAREARDQIARGVDPIAERRRIAAGLAAADAKRMTFAEAAKRVHAIKVAEFKNGKHADQWLNTLEQHANPKIGRLDVSEVDFHAVLRCLEPIWKTRTETAKRLRGRIESVLAWATVNGFRAGDNPARWRGNLDAALPKPGSIAKVVHFRALPYAAVPAFMAALRQRDGMAARALEFAILTAARSGEVRGAVWGEVDLDAKLWTVPAERIKARRAHRVALSAPAVAVLTALKSNREPGDLVFPAPAGGMLSDMTLSAVLKRMKFDAVPHGFRSSFRDWAAETTNFPREVAEAALAHVVGDKVEAAYRRGDLFEKRRRLMEAWSGYCASASITD